MHLRLCHRHVLARLFPPLSHLLLPGPRLLARLLLSPAAPLWHTAATVAFAQKLFIGCCWLLGGWVVCGCLVVPACCVSGVQAWGTLEARGEGEEGPQAFGSGAVRGKTWTIGVSSG